VAITSTVPEPTHASPIPVTITFSEPVTGLTLVDVVVANGSAAALSGGPTVYNTSVTPTGQGAVTVSLAVGAAADAAGNASTAAALVRVYDSVAPTLTGLTDDALPARSKTWTWDSSEPLSRFRYLIDTNPGGAPTGTYDAVASATQAAGDGTHYLHVQTQDAAGNESAVVTVHALLDNTAPLVTGLAADPGPRRAKTWTWAGSDTDDALQYRHTIDQASDASPGGVYSDVTTAAKDAAEGTWYLHVQARDRAGNESAVATVAVLLDNTGPTVTGLADDDVPARSKTWTWGSSEALTRFRHCLDANPGGAPTGAYSSATTATQPAGDGTYYLHVQAQDAAGNEGAVTTVRALLDNTAPTVTGLAADPGPLRAKTWTWAGSDADSLLVFRAAIDQVPDGSPDGAYSDITAATKDAAEGTWYLHIQARDRAGNESAVATVAVLLDNTAPGVNGLADDEVPRRSKTWTWSSGEALTRFRALIDTTPGSAPTGAYGSVTTATQPAGDGTYYLHLQAQDAAGNESAVATVRALLDNTAPLVSGLFDDPGPCRAKTWTWAGSDADSVLVFRAAIDQAPDASPDGAYSDGTTAAKDAAEGTWYLHVQARDRAGNESAVATVAVLLDSSGPSVTGLTDDDVPAPSKTWTWGSSEAVSRFRYLIDTNPGSAPTSTYGTVTTATQATGDGTYYLHLQAQDAAGNESAVVTVRALLDNTAPVVTGLLDDPGPRQARTWTWAGSDADSVLVFRAVIDQAPDGSPGGAYSDVTTAAKDAAEGIWYLHVQARDRAGNESAVATAAVLLDNTAPSVTGLVDDEVPAPRKIWTWGSGETPSRFRYRVDTSPSGAPTGAYGTVTTATQPAGDGTYYLHVQAQDAAGNESAVATVRALLDNTPPVVTGLLDDPGPRQAKTWTWAGSDADRVLVFRAALDQAPGGSPNDAYSDVTTATKDAAEGTWYLHVQACDRAGNESAVATAAVLLDNTAPAVTGLTDDDVPARSKTWTWGGGKSATRFRHLVDTRPDSAPAGPYSFVTTATQAAGDGVYYLHVQATDTAGNASAVVTVQALLDNTPPSPPGVDGMALCHSATPTWTWASGGGAGAGAFRCALDDPSLLASTAETTQTTFTPAGALAEGPRALYVQERDAAGNWSAPGLATTVVDAECTATFVAGAHGCLRGAPPQQLLPYGASTTPIAAVADFAYVFDSWSDARTSNPRTDTNVTADLHLTAAFRPANPASPSGDFLARVTPADGTARRLWDLTGDYATTVADSPLLLRMVHDATGRLTGTALCTFANTTLVTMPIRGSVKGRAGSVTLTGVMGGTDPARTVTMALTLSLMVDPANLLLTGRLTGAFKANGTTTPVSQYLALPIPAPMDGTWALQLALDQAGRAVAGTALLTLANGTDGAFVVQGRTRGANVVLNLAAGPAGRGLEAEATISPLEGGWALLQTLSARAYGQTIGW
jgi:P2-related tail formation protein/nitrous oxide reductase accessory protein NosL